MIAPQNPKTPLYFIINAGQESKGETLLR